MPTIDQLSPATSSSDADEFIVSQGGIARKVTRAQILNGVQPQITVSAGSLLGGVPWGSGTPATISIGANLVLNGSTLSATATPFTLSELPHGIVPQGPDLIALSQGGTNVVVSYSQLLSGISGSSVIDVSQATVKPQGSGAALPLGTLISELLPLSGGSLAGALALAGNPTSPAHAASKAYVDAKASSQLSLSGGTLTGRLTLASGPANPNDAATKAYVDGASAVHLPLSGGSLAGTLTLAGDPATALQAATKQYADQKLSRSGDTLTGFLTLAGSPSMPLQAATKGYVDAGVGSAVPLAGGTMTGGLFLAADPTCAAQAATKQYADQRILRTGDTLTGLLTLAGAPSEPMHAAPKSYVDAQLAGAVTSSGATMSGVLILAADPVAPLSAATKEYADQKLSRTGDSLTGALYLSGAPSAPLQAATKAYVDAAASTTSFQAGGSFSGAVYLAGNPIAPLQAVTKQYSDAHVWRSGDTLTGALILAADPTVQAQAATKNYVDMQLAGQMPRGGGSLTGALYLSGDPVSTLQASTKHYVDTQVATMLPLSGGSLIGLLSLVSSPQSALHAAPKQYVDGAVAALLPLSGGSMSGMLMLPAVPTSPLHAATKSYVDANPTAARVINVCLPPYNAALNGVADDTPAFVAAYQAATADSVIYVPNGTASLKQPSAWGVALTKRVKWIVDGTVLMDGTPLGSAVPNGSGPAALVLPGFVAGHAPSGNTFSQGSSTPTDIAVTQSAYIVNHNGGTSGVIANSRTDSIIYNSPSNYVWNGLDRLLWAGVSSGTTNAPAQHVARYIQTIRGTASTGSNGQSLTQPQLWAACIEYHDATGQPSSVTGASLTTEMDWYGNGLDDANARTIQSLVVGQSNTSGAPVEVGNIIGVWLAGGSSGSAKTVLRVSIPFSSSVIDTTGAQQINNAPVIRMASGQSIAFEPTNSYTLQYNGAADVLYWNQGTLSFPVGKGICVGYADIFSANTTLPNYISGNIIFLNGATAYTITLPPASTVAAGTGYTFSVGATAPVTIAPSGTDAIDSSPVVLHTHDRYHIISDGAGAWHEVFWVNMVSPRFLGPMTLASYTVAALPSGMPAGAKAFASNGRKPNEAAGAGSGVEVFFDGSRWISVCSGSQVAS